MHNTTAARPPMAPAAAMAAVSLPGLALAKSRLLGDGQAHVDVDVDWAPLVTVSVTVLIAVSVTPSAI